MKKKMFNILMPLYFIGFLVSLPLMYGLSFAYWQRKWPLLAEQDRRKDKTDSMKLAALGALIWPVGWMLSFLGFDHFKYGIKFK